MKVKELVSELLDLDQDKEIGIMYQDRDDNTFFPSKIICISEEKILKEDPNMKIKWHNKGYHMY